MRTGKMHRQIYCMHYYFTRLFMTTLRAMVYLKLNNAFSRIECLAILSASFNRQLSCNLL